MLDWLKIAKTQAEERSRSLPFPTTKDENYRFTSLEPMVGERGAKENLPAEFLTVEEEEGLLLSLAGEKVHSFGEAEGIFVTSLLEAAQRGSQIVRSALHDTNLFAEDKFAQLAVARWQNGAFVHIPAGIKVNKPLRLGAFSSGGEEYLRHLIVLDEGAEAVIVQEYASGDAPLFVSDLVELKLGKNAKLHWVILQRYGEETQAVWRQRIELASGADLQITPVHLGGKRLQMRQEVKLGEEANLELAGAAQGNKSQHFDFWLDVDHEKPKSKSQMDLCFVMGGNSRAVFNGLIQIRKQASDCAATQKSRSLLLSPKATVHAIPKLIIQTDAVKCSHGASISSVNPEQVHYLRSRGIPPVEAERMIVRGFTEPVLQRLPTENLYGRAQSSLDAKEGGWLQ